MHNHFARLVTFVCVVPVFVAPIFVATVLVATVLANPALAEKKKPARAKPTPTATSTPVPTPQPAPTPEEQFSFERVIQRAEALAKAPYLDDTGKISGEWLKVSYDDHRNIRFRTQHAFLRGKSPFEVQFFHPGFLFERTIGFSVVEGSTALEVPFESSWFNYEWGEKPVPSIPPNMQFAGFRVHYPLHSQEYKDEVMVFLGASYFKFLGRKQKYGLSARGLAIDTAGSKAEEFPHFEQFWMYRPEADATVLTVFALMVSPSISGAYSFTLRPGTNSQMEVKAVLFPRTRIEKLGIAPLTSMFLFGENRLRSFDDFRPEVHDSDGLLMHTSTGEWIWRPLVNRDYLNIASYFDSDPKGFGLFQRDRNFENYQDLEAFYQERPSYWIEPLAPWGRGHIELVELTTNSETNDNIVSYWVPERKPEAGERLEYSYRITSLLKDDPKLSPNGRAVATRFSTAQRPGSDDVAALRGRLFVIDFAGADFDFLDAAQPVEGIVTHSSGVVTKIIPQKNPNTGGWRLTFDFFPEKEKSADFRAYLKLGDRTLTETWTYLWTPK